MVFELLQKREVPKMYGSFNRIGSNFWTNGDARSGQTIGVKKGIAWLSVFWEKVYGFIPFHLCHYMIFMMYVICFCTADTPLDSSACRTWKAEMVGPGTSGHQSPSSLPGKPTAKSSTSSPRRYRNQQISAGRNPELIFKTCRKLVISCYNISYTVYVKKKTSFTLGW